MSKGCPICKKEMEETSKDVFYCDVDDMSFNMSKGKTIAKTDDGETKTRIQQLEEDVAYLKQDKSKHRSQKDFWED